MIKTSRIRNFTDFNFTPLKRRSSIMNLSWKFFQSENTNNRISVHVIYVPTRDDIKRDFFFISAPYLKPCSKSSPDFNKCMIENEEALLPNIINGKSIAISIFHLVTPFRECLKALELAIALARCPCSRFNYTPGTYLNPQLFHTRKRYAGRVFVLQFSLQHTQTLTWRWQFYRKKNIPR